MSEYPDIQPKDTYFNGVWYQSKLEAQWAVFFSAANIVYQSQPGTFPKIGGGGYKPDFYLPQFDLYVEVKRNTPQGIQEIYDRCEKAIYWGSNIKQILILSNVPIGHSPDGGIWHFPIIYWKANGVEWGWWFFFDGYHEEIGEFVTGKIAGMAYRKPPKHLSLGRECKESISPISDHELKKHWPYNAKYTQEDVNMWINIQEGDNKYTFKALDKANKAWFGKYGQPDTKSVFEEENEQ